MDRRRRNKKQKINLSEWVAGEKSKKSPHHEWLKQGEIKNSKAHKGTLPQKPPAAVKNPEYTSHACLT
jgi:hypothetical protein